MQCFIALEEGGARIARLVTRDFVEDLALTQLLAALKDELATLDQATRAKWPAGTRPRASRGKRLRLVPTIPHKT